MFEGVQKLLGQHNWQYSFLNFLPLVHARLQSEPPTLVWTLLSVVSVPEYGRGRSLRYYFIYSKLVTCNILLVSKSQIPLHRDCQILESMA